MKIASQLTAIAQSVGTKTPPAFENGPGFHETLATASGVGIASSRKVQVDGKQQATSGKKKDVAASSSTIDTAVAEENIRNPQMQDGASQISVVPLVVPDPVVNEQNTNLPQSVSDFSNHSIGNAGSFNSVSSEISSVLPVAPSPIDRIAADSRATEPSVPKMFNKLIDHEASDRATDIQAAPATTNNYDNKVEENQQAKTQVVEPALNNDSLVSLAPSLPEISPAKVTDNQSIKADAVDQQPPSSTDISSLTAQQTIAGAIQSANPAPPFPALSPISDPHTAPKLSKDNAVDLSSVPTKEVASRPSGPISKLKPATSATEARDRATNDKNSEDTTPSVPAATNVPFAKSLDTSGNVNHVANSFTSTSETASVQLTVQSGSTERLGNIAQTQHSATTPTEAKLLSVPNQTYSDNPATQGLTNAQLTQSLRSSEMKLGMQSAEFGNISINTSLNHQAISAQISIDHSELSRTLAVHLPAIEEKLGSTYGVQARVELRESNNPTPSGDSGQGSFSQQSQGRRQSEHGEVSAIPSLLPGQIVNRSVLSIAPVATSGLRLDIRI